MTPDPYQERAKYVWDYVGKNVSAGDENIYFIAAAIREAVSEQEQWLANRLLEWLKTKKPATTAFTEGPLRQVAYAIEEKIREAVEEFAKGRMTYMSNDFAHDRELVKHREAGIRAAAFEECAKIADDQCGICPDEDGDCCPASNHRAAKAIRTAKEAI